MPAADDEQSSAVQSAPAPVPAPAQGPAPQQDRLADLYQRPSVERMRQLKAADFEKFVAYVLNHAGYWIKHTGPFFRRGVDIELFASERGLPMGGVECKRYNVKPPIGRGPVQTLAGARALNDGTLPGYLITTSTFTNQAEDEAGAHGNLHLLDGEQLVRYVRYVYGSAGVGSEAAPTHIPPALIPPQVIRLADGVVAKLSTPAPHIIAIANNKGGVGKTTTARFLGLGLAARGQRVLLIDMDAQANLSEAVLGSGLDAFVPPTLADYFAGACALAEAIHPSPMHPLLSIIPSQPLLARYDTGGFGRPDLELRFVEQVYTTLAPLQCDWIVIDTPPNVSLFTRAALAAADHVLVPVRARYSSVRGTLNMLDARNAMAALMGREAKLLGGLLTHWGEDNASKLSEAQLSGIFEAAQSRLLPARIPLSNAIESNPNAATGARQAYDDLVREVMTHVGLG